MSAGVRMIGPGHWLLRLSAGGTHDLRLLNCQTAAYTTRPAAAARLQGAAILERPRDQTRKKVGVSK